MKKIFTMILLALAAVGAASAQRLQVGVYGGVNTVDYGFRPVEIDGMTFSPGDRKFGYDAGLRLRLHLSKWLDLQTGLNYGMVDYEYLARTQSSPLRKCTIETERLEMPVELGIRIGFVRLFGGGMFRLAAGSHSSNARFLTVDYNDSDVALTGGIGIGVKKFFLDCRVTGYPGSATRNTLQYNCVKRDIAVDRHLVYGLSMGFFF